MELRKEFSFTSVSRRVPQTPGSNLLGPLAILKGTWKGQGFNQIWRPFQGGPAGQDRFLELNETLETLEFEEIPGDIPNRGFLQPDINLHGLRYLQQIQDANVLGPNGELAGIHVEHGMWLSVPATTNPSDPTNVVRMATIPHGTSLVAQGTAQAPIHTAPAIDPVSIATFTIGTAPPTNTAIAIFPERNLSTLPPTPFRTDAGDIPNVTQDMVDNPNVVLSLGLEGKTVISTVIIKISTIAPNPATTTPPAFPGPTTGGGISNIAFLQGVGPNPNAVAAQMDATFFIETLQDADGNIKHQLQYTQKVLLNFNTLSWPHVSVATLIKQ